MFQTIRRLMSKPRNLTGYKKLFSIVTLSAIIIILNTFGNIIEFERAPLRNDDADRPRKNLSRSMITKSPSRKELEPIYLSTYLPTYLTTYLPTLETVKNTKRPDACVNCNPHNYNILINNKAICSGGNGGDFSWPKPFLLMLIYSRPSAVESRSVIRETWADITKNNTGQVRHVFLFGQSDDPTENRIIEWERLVTNIGSNGYKLS